LDSAVDAATKTSIFAGLGAVVSFDLFRGFDCLG
jgi:hypothetical protein